MARIPYPDPESLPEADREFLAELPQLNISRMLAGSPSMFRPLTRVFSAYLSDGVLDKITREIVILRVGHLCHSEYEVTNHERVARSPAGFYPGAHCGAGARSTAAGCIYIGRAIGAGFC